MAVRRRWFAVLLLAACATCLIRSPCHIDGTTLLRDGSSIGRRDSDEVRRRLSLLPDPKSVQAVDRVGNDVEPDSLAELTKIIPLPAELHRRLLRRHDNICKMS